MRYFVTGATGFVGGALTRRLLADGHQVVALVRDPEAAGELERAGAELAAGDVTDASSLDDPIRGVDGAFHVAAWYRIGSDPRDADAINVDGTRNVLDAMRRHRIARGVYTSTLAVNSDTGGRVVDERYRYDGPHLNAYDASKWRAHFAVAVPAIEAGLPLVIVMPGVVYGPGDTSQLGALMRRALTGRPVALPGGGGVCWAHVDDIAAAHVLAMDRGRPGHSYIIAGRCHSYREAFEAAARVTGRRMRALWLSPAALRCSARLARLIERVVRLPDDYSSETIRATAGVTYYGDNLRAREELGYAPRSLERGLRDTFGGPSARGETSAGPANG
jgi:nucleoside-diphosphate-sugar epimerase